jgi:diacylglycerol O-acyltransferase / wax synthase
MPGARLSALDTSFLEVESPTAHMHVGWAGLLAPPRDSRAPSFTELRDHIARRLGRAPRYRQKLATTPLGLHDPVWVDDAGFDPDRHIMSAPSSDLGEVVDTVMSVPLERDRPLWELWIVDGLPEGHIGLVGKAHHCMVDGLAAVELSTLLLDPTPEPEEPEPDCWSAADPPGGLTLFARGVGARLRDQLELARAPLGLALSPRRVLGLPGAVAGAAHTAAHALLPPAPTSELNRPSSPFRHLSALRRPLDDLRTVKQSFGTTVNDVLLAGAAGALRRFAAERGEPPTPLKAMVPVSVRGADDEDGLGNRISFMFVRLPCDEPEPVRRLMDVHELTSERKEGGEPEDADAAIRALGRAPQLVRRAVSHLAASPQLFNVVVSNIPGPRQPLYLRGCELLEAYPVVPLAERHALSIGMTTVCESACFGLYADPETLPDADQVAGHLDASIDELLALAG